MSGASAIEWTDATWNPVTGCSRVSPGCAHCYALELAPRLRAMGVQRYIDAGDGGRGSGPAFGVTLHDDVLDQPLRWRRPRRVFVNSMSDLFHEEVPDEFVARIFDVMRRAPQHTFQILTKRPERMQRWLQWESPFRFEDPLRNVWLGVSIENRRYVGRADLLRDTPAAVRFISAEPLLGPLCAPQGSPLRGDVMAERFGIHASGGSFDLWQWDDGYVGPDLNLEGIDWLIAGGESGARHRPVDVEWVRDLRNECADTGVAFLFKQWGGRTPKAGGRDLDGRTWDEFPTTGAVA